MKRFDVPPTCHLCGQLIHRDVQTVHKRTFHSGCLTKIVKETHADTRQVTESLKR
jgi:hypothetical protein